MSSVWRAVKRFMVSLLGIMLLVSFGIIALWARLFAKRTRDVAMGPQPLINSVYHKQALERQGYRVSTFVYNTYFITQAFDVIFPLQGPWRCLSPLRAFTWIVMNHRILYSYCNGTMSYASRCYGWVHRCFKRWEATLYHWAGMKMVLLPYGSDVHDLDLCPNLLMKHAMMADYPQFHKASYEQIRLSMAHWVLQADHVLSGCDWVWYMAHWDTLRMGHFCVDTDALQPAQQAAKRPGETVRIFHGPNHVHLKGTRHFQQAIAQLQAEGYAVELVFVQNKSNHELLDIMRSCDIVADQLIIGWYAMTAIEAMALGKPVICFLHPDLLDLYVEQGLVTRDELPIIHARYDGVADALRPWLDAPEQLPLLGERSRAFVEKHHSLDVIGHLFSGINQSLGVPPSQSGESL